MIDCANGTVNTRFGERTLSLNVFSSLTDPNAEERCFMVDRTEEARVKNGKKKKKKVKKRAKVNQDGMRVRALDPSFAMVDALSQDGEDACLAAEGCKHPTRPP